MAQLTSTTIHSSPRRRSQRVLMHVAIKVRGIDAQGNKFEEDTQTLAINAHGALIQLQARVTSGSAVSMKNDRTGDEQECHVAFLGPVRSGKAEIGLEFSGPCPGFWRIAFPPEDWNPRSPEARTISSIRPKDK